MSNRIYELAQRTKIESRKVLEDASPGVDASVPSNTLDDAIADKIREMYYPKKEPVSTQRTARLVKAVKTAPAPTTEPEAAPAAPTPAPTPTVQAAPAAPPAPTTVTRPLTPPEAASRLVKLPAPAPRLSAPPPPVAEEEEAAPTPVPTPAPIPTPVPPPASVEVVPEVQDPRLRLRQRLNR
ncbi:MAG: hypothetical protein U0Y68_16210 [Blastocatellia bacterium]